MSSSTKPNFSCTALTNSAKQLAVNGAFDTTVFDSVNLVPSQLGDVTRTSGQVNESWILSVGDLVAVAIDVPVTLVLV